ncbi:tRNA glutamyl-Q(34) synthetase GluQRS [Rhodoblastus acidophilus]|uniref:tRNA glutamyl-Q(34) synthetase GluQRS n=1 Tax=Candidatus Rhodoblastus alkanivorans TaxID=2954117 RepID=A0ABS9Z1N8_9HYPH|nr:tRNA glutamyl-Q(34) synthetase GluQRS [Candidatus Rhodoblastus alkanivorans]MCI4678131.1 tRNA glutamyl-Q(34) synthetase GluQRS [Candidatus Rhodoblastus alkanivorans]MCI4681528.1 tRNA glutamyl-Q(34) synthetase GluQRS [Candidatus Rhodoblastus alkanivorans]MDI4642576.1 tRNA glutamyl-Q(34) synthetase GluQRS [Rhodoblastus acidophilus]
MKERSEDADPECRSVFRFAPSPNGYLHLGHAYSALFNVKLAQACGGKMLLRIEDIDSERSRRSFEAALIEDLRWLGFNWTGAPRRQSEHMADYRAALDRLARRGLAYPCFCSRGEIARACAARTNWPRDPDGVFLYPGACRDLSVGERNARIEAGARWSFRLDMEKALIEIGKPLTYMEFHEGDAGVKVTAEPSAWGDALIGRRDAPASYHIACVLDDHAQGVTDVVRGLDLDAATGLHRLLQALLGLRTPQYHHHRLVLDDQGRKLSKSKSSPSLRDLRARGVSAAQIREELSRQMQIAL